MSHPDVTNESGFTYDALHVCDESGVPVFVALMQATCAIAGDGTVVLLKEQPSIKMAGEWYGDPATSSLKLEPQMAFMKPATDIVLLGHAYPSARGSPEGLVGIRIGSLQKVARVLGERRLIRRRRQTIITAPEPFDRIPIVYERSFGGWDRRRESPEQHVFDRRNPVGTGFHDGSIDDDHDVLLPNFEDPNHPLQQYGETPPPVGFGFIPADWEPRASYAGTYDETWDKTRKPLLPTDFDQRFFNAASPGLIAAGYLQGDEHVVVIGASPEGRIEFQLPGIAPPECAVGLRAAPRAMLRGALDTLIVDMDNRLLTMIWRAHLRLRSGAHEVVSVEVPPVVEDEQEDTDEI